MSIAFIKYRVSIRLTTFISSMSIRLFLPCLTDIYPKIDCGSFEDIEEGLLCVEPILLLLSVI